MKKPHIERFLTHDIYISPLEMVGDEAARTARVWFAQGRDASRSAQVKYTFEDFDRADGRRSMRLAARLRRRDRRAHGAGAAGARDQHGDRQRATASRPTCRAAARSRSSTSTRTRGRVALALPGAARTGASADVLAVEVSTKPFINLVWLGAIVMLGSAFLSVIRRAQDLGGRAAGAEAGRGRRSGRRPAAASRRHAGPGSIAEPGPVLDLGQLHGCAVSCRPVPDPTMFESLNDPVDVLTVVRRTARCSPCASAGRGGSSACAR